jgi:hypothetical protein
MSVIIFIGIKAPEPTVTLQSPLRRQEVGVLAVPNDSRQNGEMCFSGLRTYTMGSSLRLCRLEWYSNKAKQVFSALNRRFGRPHSPDAFSTKNRPLFRGVKARHSDQPNHPKSLPKHSPTEPPDSPSRPREIFSDSCRELLGR